MRGLHAFAFFIGTSASAQDIALQLPIDCTLGDTCYIQQFVDTDPGPDARDFTCGSLSYDGHTGTDFALPTQADQARGVAVLAAAAGTVTGTRNDMPDILQSAPNAPDVSDRECGNGVVLRHDNGWETQYCHLGQGSVTVRSGDTVSAGDTLGFVGLSGQSEFPHLHLSVRHNGETVDPFAPSAADTCGDTPDQTLWSTPPAYVAGGILGSGLSRTVPEYHQIKAGHTFPALDRTSLLIGWSYYFGSRVGDELTLTILGPDGIVSDVTETLPQRALGYQFAGQRPPNRGWTPGLYTMTTTLSRDGATVSTAITTAIIP